MNRENYSPGPANLAHIEKDGEDWTLVLVKELHHPPARVWEAITDPVHLREWAPFDSDANLGKTGTKANLSMAGTPKEIVTETTVMKAVDEKELEYMWGGHYTRWQLEPMGQGTVLTLWTKIPRPYIGMGAAGWHICFDVMDHYLSGDPMGRTVGPDAMKFGGWQQLHKEYAAQFGIEAPSW